jgi:hypothetical protein
LTKQIENLSEDKTDLNQVNGTVTITDIGDFCPTNDLYVQIYQLKCIFRLKKKNLEYNLPFSHIMAHAL